MKNTGAYPRVHVDTTPVAAISQSGGVLLTETVRVTGLDRALSDALALGGDALADIGVLRGEPGIFGRVASDPTVSRTIAALAADADAAIAAINTARAVARERAWQLAGEHAPDHTATAKDPMIIDLDATLITAHSDKQDAKPTFKRGYGFHPLCAFLDHGPAGTGETLAITLRPGNADSNTAADHIDVVKQALQQLPGGAARPGKKVLIRADGGGGTQAFIAWLTGRRLSYSIEFTLPFKTPELYRMIPETLWTPAYDADGEVRDGADVAEFTGILNLTKWPKDMRVIVRRERPHPGAQLRFEDVDGYRLTAFVTSTARGQLPVLELRHRRRARCEDRIWCHLVALDTDLTAWTGMLAHPDQPARRWEPKRLRLRLFSIPAAIARTGRRTILRLSNRAAWARIALAAISRLRAHARAPG